MGVDRLHRILLCGHCMSRMLVWRVCAAVQTCCRLAAWILKEADVGYQVLTRRQLAAWQGWGNMTRPKYFASISAYLELRKNIDAAERRLHSTVVFASVLVYPVGVGKKQNVIDIGYAPALSSTSPSLVLKVTTT
jgi:hypothetical protein